MQLSFIAPEMSVIAQVLAGAKDVDVFNSKIKALIESENFDERVENLADDHHSSKFALIVSEKDKDSIEFANVLLMLSSVESMYSSVRDVVTTEKFLFFNAAIAKSYEMIVQGKDEPDDFKLSKRITKESLQRIYDGFSFDDPQFTQIIEDDNESVLFMLTGALYPDTWRTLERLGISSTSLILAYDESDYNKRIPGFCYLFTPGVVALSMLEESSGVLPDKIMEDLKRFPKAEENKDESN